MVDRHKDAELGITWLTLEMAAEDLFGDAPETDKRRRRNMGNRACIVFFDRNRVSPTVYLHWHGDAVPGWLEPAQGAHDRDASATLPTPPPGSSASATPTSTAT